MENPDLRIAMGMESDQKGVRIRRIEPTAPESHVLKPSDVILSFDGINIANDGTGKQLPPTTQHTHTPVGNYLSSKVCCYDHVLYVFHV